MMMVVLLASEILVMNARKKEKLAQLFVVMASREELKFVMTKTK